jgi:hypothetical protein
MQQSRCRRTKTFDKKKPKLKSLPQRKPILTDLQKKSNSHSKLLLEVLKKESKI